MPKYILYWSLVKLKGKGNLFFEGASSDLSSKLSLTYGRNVSRYKSVHHPLYTVPVGTAITLAFFKQIS